MSGQISVLSPSSPSPGRVGTAALLLHQLPVNPAAWGAAASRANTAKSGKNHPGRVGRNGSPPLLIQQGFQSDCLAEHWGPQPRGCDSPGHVALGDRVRVALAVLGGLSDLSDNHSCVGALEGVMSFSFVSC